MDSTSSSVHRESLVTTGQLIAASPIRTHRRSERLPLSVAGRLTWRDARGVQRFATVVTRDISEDGVYLECRGGEPIYYCDPHPTTGNFKKVSRTDGCRPMMNLPDACALALISSATS